MAWNRPEAAETERRSGTDGVPAAHAPFDLHLHSSYSDGSDRPVELVERAAARGLTLAALTDHDCVDGVAEAVAAGEACGVRVLPSLEMDCEWPGELHILGLDVDITEPRLAAALETARRRRAERNIRILRMLRTAGYDIEDRMTDDSGVMTRLHIALALAEAGYADSIRDAFRRYLNRGCIAYAAVERFPPREVVALILGAGGVPVWAHPLHGGDVNPHRLAPLFRSYGLMGLEAYHPSASEGQAELLVSVARQNGLLITCGSDYHGVHRPDVAIGQTWRDVPALAECRAFFERRSVRR